MTFTGTPFLILLLVTYPLWLLCKQRYWPKLFVLLAASLVFYGHDDWRLLLLLGAYGVVDWAVAQSIGRARQPRLPLSLGIVFNLGVLVFWKYTPMLLRTLAPLSPRLAQLRSLTVPDVWSVPVGLSFYSFTGIAYMVDVYRGITPAERNVVRSALHLSFFPHLMAGPILRADEFLTKLRPERLPQRAEAPREAALLLARGYFKKMVLADRIALAIDPFFLHVGEPATAGVWSLPFLYLYAFQIYFDFSGYTDIARGLALFFGFRWPDNFNLPYLAASPREFWQRWHMTLSRFLRDYLYIPLGGNRVAGWRTQLNVMITMLLGGLWHGGNWSFLLWGGLHGGYVLAHREWAASRVRNHLRERSAALAVVLRPVAIALTFNVVCLTWSFFRITTLHQSLACLRSSFVFDADKLFSGGSRDLSLWLLLATYGAIILAAHWFNLFPQPEASEVDPRRTAFADGFAWGVALTVLTLAVLLAPNGETPSFIYFQF